MKYLQRLLSFIVYSNLFIAFCAVAMAIQSSRLLLHEPPNIDLLYFVFFSTICSYSFHWYLTEVSVLPSPRITWTKQFKLLIVVLFFAGLAGSSVFFIRLIDFWPWLLFAAVITFLYSAPKIPHPWFRALRKIALGKTIFLALVWMYVTSVLPLVIANYPWRADFTLFIIGRFFLIYAICILFDYRDREDDKATGIRSLITYLSKKSITRLFIFSLLIFAVVTLALLHYNYKPAVVALLIIPGIITAVLFNYATRHFTDMLFYLVLDGIMALSALLMLIPGTGKL